MSDVPTYDGASLSGGRPAVGKTGTVQSHVENQNNDAWMVDQHGAGAAITCDDVDNPRR